MAKQTPNRYRERLARNVLKQPLEGKEEHVGAPMPRPPVVKEVPAVPFISTQESDSDEPQYFDKDAVLAAASRYYVEAKHLASLGRGPLQDEMVTTTLVRDKVNLYRSAQEALEALGFDPITEAIHHYNECSDMLLKERFKTFPSSGVIAALVNAKRAIIKDLLTYGYASKKDEGDDSENDLTVPDFIVTIEDEEGNSKPFVIGRDTVGIDIDAVVSLEADRSKSRTREEIYDGDTD